MAKKKENTKQRYRKGGPARLDMRKGGRVALGKGGSGSSKSKEEEKKPEEITTATKAKTEEEVTGTEKGTRRSRIKAKRTGRQKTRKAGRRAKKASLQAGATRSEARADKSSVKKATNEKGERTLEAAEKQEAALLNPKTSTQIQQTQSSDTRGPFKKWRDNRKKESTSSVGGGTGGVGIYDTAGGPSITGPVGTAASIESGRLIPSEAGQQLGGGIPVSGVPPEKQAPVMPAAPQKTIPTETKTGKDRVTITQPAALETGVTAGPEVVEEVTEEPVNPLLGGSELGNWVADQGKDGNRKLYNVEGDRNSGYLMDIWWVTQDGHVGHTTEGWSRVPKADRSRVFRTQEDAHVMIQAYDQYQAQLAAQARGEDVSVAAPAFAAQKHEVPEERRERIARTAETVEEAAEGKVPEAAIIPDAIKAGDAVPDEQTVQFDELTDEQRAQATQVTDEDITDETVTTGVTTAAEVPEDIEAVTYTAEEVPEDVLFDPASGKIRLEDIAELEEQALTFVGEGAKFSDEQKDRGIADRITGESVSREAAAQVAGTTLPRVLRAKKQLRKAGLSEDDLNLIGNDPEALEEKLMEYTEAQRGMIGNLPEEAMMNTQLIALLDGMESGEIPPWARPAVSAVNQLMAVRGLDASTVGRDALFNAVIQAAMPIAQYNAQSIKESATLQTTIEAQAEQLNAQLNQEAAQNHANRVFNLNLKQMDVDQQTELFNKQFLQTTSLEEVNKEQQVTIQQAVNQTQLDVANLNTQERLQVRNADAFLSMNMSNITREQEGKMIVAQQEHQRILSNQAAFNAAEQFNATSEMQTDQFMTSLASQIELNNKQRADAMEQFNSTQENAAEARRTNREADIAKFNAQLVTQVDEFNSQQDFARNQWTAENRRLVMQSNTTWRRNTNLENTRAQNTINGQNAQNAFNISAQSLAFLWQELRDQADFDFRAVENEENRKVQIVSTALANEGKAGEKYGPYLSTLISTLSNSYTGGYG